jgi:AraC-like DNA-binding protein
LKIIRSNQTWRVVESFSSVSHCLERLAYRKGYRVADVCATLGCSIRYLHTLFVRDIGLPPKYWMKLERMVVARRKLEGGKPPEEVATELGFMSIHTFKRQFLQFYQTTPAKFQSDRILFDPTDAVSAEPPMKSGKKDRPRKPGNGK